MEIDEEKVYRDLQRSLYKLPISFPETKSGVEIRILKHIFSPLQALIGSKLEFNLKPIHVIYNDLNENQLSFEKLEESLDEMYKQGLIMRGIKTEEGKAIKYYAAFPFMLGFYEFQKNKMTEEYIYDVDQYLAEEYGNEIIKTRIPQLRTIPIEEVVGSENTIASYDDFRQLLDNCGEPIVVSQCICRKKNDLTGRSCKKTDLRESCFSFRSAGVAYLERGLGRIISKEKALKIIWQAEEEGLVIQAGNSQRPMSICLCCGCCCNLLYNLKNYETPALYTGSNYHAQVDSEICTGCGVCETRCQMDAIKVIDTISQVNLDRCIGCGVCVPTCPVSAIKLIEKDERDKTIPAKNTIEMYARIAKNK